MVSIIHQVILLDTKFVIAITLFALTSIIVID